MHRCAASRCAGRGRRLSGRDSQLTATPGLNRDRRETALRMERGFSPGRGGLSKQRGCSGFRAVPAAKRQPDGRRAVHDADGPGNYHLVRADLRRASQVIKSLRGARGAAVGPPGDRHIVRGDGV
jgi:hypothetical protein